MPVYFSIIISMYNRERCIARAIDSCLKQDFEDYEIIVVDDGSTDKSAELARGYSNLRIKIVHHEVNRGVSPARNTGVFHATGEWIIFLDSDDELLPGALTTIFVKSQGVDANICRLQFMLKMDTGEISPYPPLENELLDYIVYIKWMEKCIGGLSEALAVVRRSTFEKVKYYDDRTLEGPYHLDFMKRFEGWAFADVVLLNHHDAENQLTRPNLTRMIQDAGDQAVSGELLLNNHSEALKKYAPRVYGNLVSGLATLHFLAGSRLKGITFALFSIRNNFFCLKNWGILLFGLLGSKPIAWLKTVRMRVLGLYR